ncbi:MAG TPA: hypothetical protein VNW90_25180 [Acetobacteraceae bacterium]|jgi:hypothetical protein|nr:hypothetical protein [Acetobacteraceae bacterium]
MGFFSPSPATSTSTSSSTTNYTPSPAIQGQWNDITGTASGLVTGPGGIVNNYQYPGQMVANPSDLMNQYWNQAGSMGANAPNMQPYQQQMTGYGSQLAGTQVDPNSINLPGYNPQSFQPGQLNLPQFGATPNVTGTTGPSGLASSYLVNPGQVQAPAAYTPQQVQAMNVSAPGSVNPITGVPNVSAPQLQQYQMNPNAYQPVSAQGLQNFTMQAAGNVAPTGLASTQSFTDPGVAQQYMSPYTQQVVNSQLAQAQVQEQQQLQQQGAQAAQAGAFGGSRSAVEAANTSIGYQQLASQIQAQGLQSAYQQAQQQFNTQQQAGLQAQQFNIGTGLQAQLANQQAQQQANVQNLSAYLQTQGLGAQTGLQAQLANQQAGLSVGQQNLQANLATQQLGATTGLQAALANQSMSYQQQLANQQAQEFGYGQQLQAGLANQQAGLQAQGMNQSAGLQSALASMGYQYGASQANAANQLQAGLAAQQLGYQGSQFNAQQMQQAALANQAAQMQAQGMTYQGGLSGALQTQNLGMQGQIQGGQMGLQSAAQQNQLRQSQQNLNMGAIQGAAGLQQQAGMLGMQGYQTGLQGLNALQQGATSNQGYNQQVADAGYQQWMNSLTLPLQGLGALAQLTAMQPLPYTMNQSGTSTGTQMPAQASPFSQILGGAFGGLGAVGSLFGREGGLAENLPELKAKKPRSKRTGLAAVVAMPQAPAFQRHGLERAA